MRGDPVTTAIANAATATVLARVMPIASIAQNVVLSVCGVTTVVIAAMGLSTWRKQLKGTSEYQLAKDLLRSVFKVKRAFSLVRNPAVFQYEYPPEMTGPTGHLKPECEYAGNVHVYQERMKPLGEAFAELEELNLDAQVEWDDEFAEMIKPLRGCRGNLLVAIQYTLEAKQAPHDQTAAELATTFAAGSVLYEIGDSEQDTFTPKLQGAIAAFEARLRPYIQR